MIGSRIDRPESTGTSPESTGTSPESIGTSPESTRRLAGAARLALGALLAAAFTAAPAALRAQDIGLDVGTAPPAVTIEDLQGNAVDLGAYVGKRPVLLEFWATWCPICKALAPRIEAAHRRFGDRVDFLVVAVAVNETPRSIRRHLAKNPVPGTVLWDVDGRATRAFDAPTTSYVVVLDRAGRVSYTGSGSDQDLEGALAKVAGG